MKPHILLGAYQVGRAPNRGMESATHIFVELADDFQWTLVTNGEMQRTARWQAGGARVVQFAFDDTAGKITRGAQLSRAAARALTGSRSKLSFHPLPQDDPTQRRPDIEPARREPCWYPEVALQEGLERTADCFRDQIMGRQ